MLVEEIMTKNPACCTSDTSLQEVAKMMVDNDCGCIPVVESESGKKPIGMITDRDITIRTVAEGRNPLDLTAADAMSNDAVTVTPDTSVEDCSNLMEEKQIRRVAVVDENGGCCGMVALADVVNYVGHQHSPELIKEVSEATAQRN